MELRTTINISPSEDKITYDDPVMFIGSCFASSIGSQMISGHMPVMINPTGAVYNPVSVCNTLDTIIDQREFFPDDLYHYDGNYVSFYHYTDFSSEDPGKVLEKINRKSREAYNFLKSSKYLFITFGTARVFRFKETGLIVSNCHKVPADKFEAELLSVDHIVTLWTKYHDRLVSLFPQLKIVFTISPVRHWKDGPFGNNVSKSVLFLALDRLLKNSPAAGYFPAYELVMDDLRDYRFYSDDMLHPSSTAIKYIWNAFSGCYMEDITMDIWKSVVKISKACNHRIMDASSVKTSDFARKMIDQINAIESKVPSVDLSFERNYFLNIQKS